MSCEIVTQVVIHAPPAAVWEALARFEAYPDWNPFIQKIAGERTPGGRLTVQLRVGHRNLRFRPRLIVWEPQRELRWCGRFLAPGLFDGEHAFILEPLAGDRTQLVQRERFGGLLVPLLMGRRMRSETRRAFMAMNAALKGLTEGYPAETAGDGG